jgi:RHS repeat-associated protein
MTGQTRYSNTAETDVVATTSYTYDDANQMTGITDKNSSGTTLVSYGYTYNAAGLVTQETRTWDSGSDTDTLGYTYTKNDQLTGVTHTDDAFANESFSYDANGNQTGTGYTTSTDNEQTASPGNTYTYDADGNMITDTITSTGDAWTYSYNFRGQMTGAVEKTSGGTVLAQVSYTYDALGRRIGMDENGTQTWTLYDGSDPIMDFNSSGSLEMRYLNGPTGDLVDSVLARESSGGTVAWYLPDRLGTVRDLINNSGSIIDHIDFSALGTVLDQSAPSEGDRMMGFAGMELDSVTGMNLAVYRVQNPGTGRWTSQDPLGFAAGDDELYRYALNDATNAVDPSGLLVEVGPITIWLTTYGGGYVGWTPIGVAVGVGVGLGIAGSQLTSPYIYDPLVGILTGGPTEPLPPLPGERRQPEPGEGPEPEPEPRPRPGPGGDAGCANNRNPAQDKLLSPGEIRKLQDAGHDVHGLKGGKNASKYDLYKDRCGNIYVKPKGGRGPGDPTGININDL